MKMTEIIKDAFLFSSKNSGRYAIYLLLSVLIVLFAIGGVLTYVFGIFDAENYLTGGVYLIISIIIGTIIAGYHLKVIKSGIDLDDNVPTFELFEDFMTGFDNVVVIVAYFLIPIIIVALVACDTDIFGKAIAVGRELVLQAFNVYIMGSSVNVAANAIYQALDIFLGSVAVTIAVAIVLFLIFLVLQAIASARLANTGSLKEALNIFESAKDIKRIGIFRVIAVLLVVIAIIIAIDLILIFILGNYPFILSTFNIIISPYFVLVTQRATGLLYSDIA